MSADRQFDLILFGATGFTGGLTAQYLARHAPIGARWALAGRSRSKLEGVRERLAAENPALAALPLLEVDAADADALQKLAQSTRVVVTTVGPYIRYGEPLVAACAAAGTHYADLTGEPEFVDLMWLRYQQTALASGARLVHCCGFDSIPHDLGVYFTVQRLPADVPLKVEGYVKVSAEFSGGTYHSAINAFSRLRETAKLHRERLRLEARPAGRRIGSTPLRIRHDAQLKTWLVPFPSIDPDIVRRSAAVLDRYGPDFRYGHFIQVRKLSTVIGLLGGIGTLVSLAQFAPTRRWLLAKKNPGDGPTPQRREKSWFRVRFVGEGGGQRVVTEVSGGDPGYSETSKMLAESALSLAFDDLPPRAGQLTPAAAMGDHLLARLRGAGIRFDEVKEI
ncbi:MAG: saccharopine dehydrogenase L-glutamate-forming [Nevskia sp.]|nr:saccharopine dehydrogenase L-glutamate-forming [Nevskia sp.]